MNLNVSKVIISRKGRPSRVVDVGNGRETTSEWVSFAHRAGWRWELRGGALHIEESTLPKPVKARSHRKGGRA